MKKNVVGFASFAVMVIFATVDIITGLSGKQLEVQEYIYNSFVIIALGSFGIAKQEKYFGKKIKNNVYKRTNKKKAIISKGYKWFTDPKNKGYDVNIVGN